MRFTFKDVLGTSVIGALTLLASEQWGIVIKEGIIGGIAHTYCTKMKALERGQPDYKECVQKQRGWTNLLVALVISLMLVAATFAVHRSFLWDKQQEDEKKASKTQETAVMR